MNDLQLKQQLRATLQQTVNDLMSAYQLSPSMMEEALEHVLLSVKDAVATEFVSKMIEEQQMQNAEMPQEPIIENEVVEEE